MSKENPEDRSQESERQRLWVEVYVQAMPICDQKIGWQLLPSYYADQAAAEFDKRFAANRVEASAKTGCSK